MSRARRSTAPLSYRLDSDDSDSDFETKVVSRKQSEKRGRENNENAVNHQDRVTKTKDPEQEAANSVHCSSERKRAKPTNDDENDDASSEYSSVESGLLTILSNVDFLSALNAR